MLPECAVPPRRGPDAVAVGVPVQVVFGDKVTPTLPPGLLPPERVAESETDPPAGTVPDGVVVMVGLPIVEVHVMAALACCLVLLASMKDARIVSTPAPLESL